MASIELKHIHRFRDRHGKRRFYARVPGQKAIPLPGIPGSSEFMLAYQDAIAAAIPRPIGAGRTVPGTVDASIVAYYVDASFLALGATTRHTRKVILEHFRREHGTKKLRTLQRAHIAAILGKKPPFAARNWLKVLRGLMAFAVNAGLRPDDPTQGVKLPKAKAGEIHTWTEEEIAQFEAWHSVGSTARLAFALLLYTAQRRGDVVQMGRQPIRDGVLSIRQEKTGTFVEIPVHPTLAAIIAETPIAGQMTFLTNISGAAFSSAGFGNVFREWCNEADLPKRCSSHGLRKAACRRLAEAGCSEHEIAAISGHESLAEVRRYTRAASRARMARSAMARSAMATVTAAFPERR
jgi:integrase